MARLRDQIVGHQAVLAKLVQAKQKKHLPHAIIFAGPSSIGKKKCALALAQDLVCESPSVGSEGYAQACGQCGPCIRVEKKQSENVRIISPDGNTLKVEQVREVLDFLSLASFGQNRVIIFEDAHLMNPQAANALLKTLEEPFENVYFILLGPEITHFMPTVRSRSQVIRFSVLTEAELQQVKPGFDNWAYASARGRIERLDSLTSEAGLSFRKEALALLESFWLDKKFIQSDVWKKAIKDREYAKLVAELWTTAFRDLLILKTQSEKLLLNLDQTERFKKLADLSTEKISQFLRALVQIQKDLLGNAEAVLLFESLWVRYARES